MLARRTVGSDRWTVRTTSYTNDVTDAHNAIAIAVDGSGVLHVAWAEHNRALHYARAIRAGSLELGPSQAMTGQHESRVTYPQFHALRDGDLLFIYRDGQSGRGDVMLNRWSVKQRAWSAMAHPLISGDGVRNAYVNLLAIDARGGWHLSWCWRESPDVASNHDVLYAFSPDAGKTWRTSNHRAYALPITPTDTFAPAAPKQISPIAAPGKISLFWPANEERDVAGYNIYRATDPNLPKDRWPKLNRALYERTTYQDEAVEAGTRYYYYLVAVDTAGNVSPPSEVVTEVVP